MFCPLRITPWRQHTVRSLMLECSHHNRVCYDSLYQRRILQIHTHNSRRELTNIRLIFSNTPGTIRFDSNMQLSRELDVIVSVNETSTVFSPSTLVPNQEVSFFPMPTWNRRACMYVRDNCGDFGTWCLSVVCLSLPTIRDSVVRVRVVSVNCARMYFESDKHCYRFSDVLFLGYSIDRHDSLVSLDWYFFTILLLGKAIDRHVTF